MSPAAGAPTPRGGAGSPIDRGCVLVTGASSGIGRELALAIAPRARRLILTARRTADHILAWSTFRTLCNQRARNSHYRKRLERLGRYEPP